MHSRIYTQAYIYTPTHIFTRTHIYIQAHTSTHNAYKCTIPNRVVKFRNGSHRRSIHTQQHQKREGIESHWIAPRLIRTAPSSRPMAILVPKHTLHREPYLKWRSQMLVMGSCVYWQNENHFGDEASCHLQEKHFKVAQSCDELCTLSCSCACQHWWNQTWIEISKWRQNYYQEILAIDRFLEILI